MCFYLRFGSLAGIPIGITSSMVGLRSCVITAVIKRYKSVTEKKKRRHDKTVLLEKAKLNRIEVLISKVLVNSIISHDEFVFINNVLKK